MDSRNHEYPSKESTIDAPEPEASRTAVWPRPRLEETSVSPLAAKGAPRISMCRFPKDTTREGEEIRLCRSDPVDGTPKWEVEAIMISDKTRVTEYDRIPS